MNGSNLGKVGALDNLEDIIGQIQNCTKCDLSKTRTNVVPGSGSSDADIVFIGEGPGFYEDREGSPFVGPAGKLLDSLLKIIDLNRDKVFITNMVKCRPPKNRDPLPIEIQTCKTFLDRQLEVVAPKILVTLGRHSFVKFFPGELLSKSRGKPRKLEGFTVFPVYHPAAALHNPGLRPIIEADFRKLPELLKTELIDSKIETDDEPLQLNFF